MAHPSIGEGELQRALEALDQCLQDYAWQPGENYLDGESLYDALHEKKITLAAIEALLERLVEQNVFRPYCQTIPAGNRIEQGMIVFRSEAESTPYLITTRERWYHYLAETKRASTQTVAVERPPTGSKAQASTESAEAESPLGMTDDGSGGGIPCRSPHAANEADRSATTRPAGSPTTDANGEFLDFSHKQRALLLALRGKDRVPIAEVMRAVYGKKTTQKSTLERLVGRTNRSLTTRDYHLEIKRKANTLSLQPVCPGPSSANGTQPRS